MRLIVGLGNPGKIYEKSRHNIGFLVVRALADSLGISLKKEKGILSLSGRIKVSGINVILAMPFSFMNLSGEPIGALVKKYRIEQNDLLVVCDDMDLEFGRIRIRSRGSSGGHHGLESVIGSLKSDDFARLRAGIGRPHADRDAADHVLSAFTRQEEKGLKEIIERACDCCDVWIREGATKAMNMFNRRIEE